MISRPQRGRRSPRIPWQNIGEAPPQHRRDIARSMAPMPDSAPGQTFFSLDTSAPARKSNAAGHVWTAFLRRKRPAIARALRPTNGNHADQLEQ